MTWKLWIDDQLDDPETKNRHVPSGFIGAKSSYRAIQLTKAIGPPSYIDIDCDLGGDDKAMVYLKWLQNNFPDCPPEYSVHSENIVEKQNVIAFIDSWKKSITL